MKKIIVIIIIAITLYSCGNKIKKTFYPTGEIFSLIEIDEKNRNDGLLKKFYKSGEISGIGQYKQGIKEGVFKEFYKSGRLKSIELYKNDIIKDTTKFYFESGELLRIKYKKENRFYQEEFNKNKQLLSKGEIKGTLNVNWWKYYSGLKKDKEVEFLIKDSKQIINQIIFYDEKGKIINEKSNYIILKIPDSIRLSSTLIGNVKLYPNLSKDKDFHMVYFNFYDSNDILISMDSTYGKNNKEAFLWGKFKEPGIKKLKGYVLERKLMKKVNKKDTSMMDIYNVEHKMYFTKEIYVIDDKK